MNYRIKALISMSITLALLFGFIVWIEPAVESLIGGSIHKYSKANLPVTIEIEKVDLTWLQLGATFQNVQITPTNDSLKFLQKVNLAKVSASFDVLSLLGGQISIPTVTAEDSQIAIDLDPILAQPSTSETIDLKPLFDMLKKLPLKKIEVFNSELTLQSQDLKLSSQTKLELLSVQNRREFLTASLMANTSTQLKDLQLLDLRLETQVVLYPSKLDILKVAAHWAGHDLEAKGEFDKLSHLKKSLNGQLQVTANLSSLAQISQKLNVVQNLKLQGAVNATGKVEFKESFIPQFELKTEVQNLHLQQFELGSFKSTLHFANHKIQSEMIEVTHSAGEAAVQNFKLQLNSQKSGSFDLNLKQLKVGPLLESMALKTVPVDLNLSGKLPCDLQISPFTLKCQPHLEARNFQLRDSKPITAKELIAIEQFAASGTLEIDDSAVMYDANLDVKGNKGSSKGRIAYAEGFNISYKTDALDIKNIKNLFSQKLEGVAALEGATQGDSSAATFYMNLQPKSFYYDDFYLGDLSTRLNYKAGKLNFENVKGSIGRTRYEGFVNLDFNQSTIDTNLNLPYLEVEEVLQVSKRHFTLPVGVQGAGRAKIELSGPFEFGQMDYDFKVEIGKGQIAGESFDKFVFNVSAKAGEFHADHVHLLKNNSSIIVTGSGHPDGNIDLHIEGNRLRLEESENINKVTSALSGLATFNMTVSGVTKDPEMNLKAEVSEVLLDSEDIPASHLAIKFSKYGMEGVASLVGNRIRSEFNYPFAENAGFTLKLRTIDWNFATFLSTLTGKTNNDFASALSTDIKIHSTAGGFKNATGSIKFDKFYLKRGNEFLENKKPLLININQGNIAITHFELLGPKSKAALVGDDFNLNRLDLSVIADIDLRLLQLFTPFLDDLGGQAYVNAKISGNLFKPQILGNALVKNGFLKLKGFPHPFEQLAADVTFSHSKIHLNSLKGVLAGGSLRGDGSISINGVSDLPINIKAQLEGASLNVPDHVKTNGNAQLVFSGKWFPYTLSGTYQVESGLIDMEFGGDEKKSEVKQSAYLPKVLSQSSFDPVLLDIQINILNTLAIKNSVLNGNLMGNIHIKGPPANPVLNGRIVTDKNSKLLFRDKIFEIQTATIHFNDPIEINPELYISARSQVAEYDINLLVQGRAKDLQMRMTSTPPLSEQDIVSLLALGMTSSKLENNVQSKEQEGQILNQLTAQVVSNFAPIKTIGNTLGVKIELTSAFDDTKNVSVPRLNFSRKLGRKFELTGSVAKTGETQDMDVKLHYYINPNLSAVGLWENKGSQENSSVSTTQDASKDVLGLDLEYKMEFR